MNVYTIYTDSHKTLLEKYLQPSVLKSGFILKTKYVKQKSKNGLYMEDGWTETMKEKIKMIIKILNTNEDVFIYSDTDIIFNYENFNPDIAKIDLGNELIAFQNDVVQLCAGFMIIKNNEKTKKIFIDTLMNIEKYKEDQTALNHVIKNNEIKYKKLKKKEYYCIRQSWFTLNNNKIWNGKKIKKPKNLKVFHANWTKGLIQKTELLEIIKNQI